VDGRGIAPGEAEAANGRGEGLTAGGIMLLMGREGAGKGAKREQQNNKGKRNARRQQSRSPQPRRRRRMSEFAAAQHSEDGEKARNGRATTATLNTATPHPPHSNAATNHSDDGNDATSNDPTTRAATTRTQHQRLNSSLTLMESTAAQHSQWQRATAAAAAPLFRAEHGRMKRGMWNAAAAASSGCVDACAGGCPPRWQWTLHPRG